MLVCSSKFWPQRTDRLFPITLWIWKPVQLDGQLEWSWFSPLGKSEKSLLLRFSPIFEGPSFLHKRAEEGLVSAALLACGCRGSHHGCTRCARTTQWYIQQISSNFALAPCLSANRAARSLVIICHMSVTMALTNQIDGWTLRDSAISHVLLNFGPELASPALNQLIRAMWDCKSPPKGWDLQSHMAESFCRFFELKSFLFQFYFSSFYLFESRIGSMMINTISPGSWGSLAASRPTTAALGPRFSHTARLPGEMVYK